MDGEFGNIGPYTACRERGLGFVTRLNRRSLYKEPEVLAKLREESWEPVPNSCSGPQRYAMDLGIMLIEPSPKTLHPDGSPYAPVEMRVVISVYAKYRKKKQRGQLLDGLQVELFAVDVPADAWPASEAVAAYFGRAAQENRFAQEDREKRLDRIISYNLPGQELAILTGLSLWNLEVVEGFKLARPQSQPEPQLLRVEHDEPVDIISSNWPKDPLLQHLLAKLDWPQLLRGRDGWTWDPEQGLLLCPEGRPMQLTSVIPKPLADGRQGILFRRQRGGCEDCEARPDCFHSAQSRTSKLLKIPAPPEIAAQLRERLSLIRQPPKSPSLLTPCALQPGPYQVRPSLFLPATARQLFHQLIDKATFHIAVTLPPKPQHLHLLAEDVAERQRRRKTWKQNLERYALPEGALIDLKIEADGQLARILPKARLSSQRRNRQEASGALGT